MYTRGDPLYAKKRCNIKDTKITLNNNNDFYLTFKTLYKLKKGYNTLCPSHFHSQTESLPKITATHANAEDATASNNMTDEEKKEIFEQLQTRHKFYYNCYDKYSPYYHYQHQQQQHSTPSHISRYPTLSTEHHHILNISNHNSNVFMTKLAAFPQSNYSLRKTIITNLGLYDDVERIREKHDILKKIHSDGSNKQRLMSYELFNCNKEKWNQKYNSNNANKKAVSTPSREHRGVIHKMKGEAIQCKGINAECKEIYEELKGERRAKERRTSRICNTIEKRSKRQSKITII